MDVIYCPECLSEVNEHTERCPDCGNRYGFVRVTQEEYEQIVLAKVGGTREVGLRVSTVTFHSKSFPIVTSNYIPGREIVEVVGVVFCSSNRRMGLTVTNLATNTFADAYKEMALKGTQMGADAIISLQIGVERAGPSAVAFSQTTVLVGTAVKLVGQK